MGFPVKVLNVGSRRVISRFLGTYPAAAHPLSEWPTIHPEQQLADQSAFRKKATSWLWLWGGSKLEAILPVAEIDVKAQGKDDTVDIPEAGALRGVHLGAPVSMA